jgi:hypothetical protein
VFPLILSPASATAVARTTTPKRPVTYRHAEPDNLCASVSPRTLFILRAESALGSLTLWNAGRAA